MERDNKGEEETIYIYKSKIRAKEREEENEQSI